MNSSTPAPPCTIVIFGAAGDLTHRLLMPAIYNLVGDRLLDDKLRIIGADHNDCNADAWAKGLLESLESFTHDTGAEFHPDTIEEVRWKWIEERLSYTVLDFTSASDFAKLKEQLTSAASGNIIFYLAVAARFFGTIIDNLAAVGLLKESEGAFRRLAIEKPFGSDLASATALNANILKVAEEEQIYRIDHFLGKEPVQGIMPLRFTNSMFEPMWNAQHIESVQVTAAESIGIGERGGFYDVTGALRDMLPNHLFNVLTMVAMERPSSFDAEPVRDEKAKLLKALHPVAPEDAARGQYAAGTMGGKATNAYLGEHEVAADSHTETYAALKLTIDNERWKGVPFFVRTGKRMASHVTTIGITFREKNNVLTLGIAPDQGFVMSFNAKEPGHSPKTGIVKVAFDYKDFFEEPPVVGYETLLYHVMVGNTLLFQREDMVDAAWAAVQPVLDAWGNSKDALEQYLPGGTGPASADALLQRDGHAWLPLTNHFGNH